MGRGQGVDALEKCLRQGLLVAARIERDELIEDMSLVRSCPNRRVQEKLLDLRPGREDMAVYTIIERFLAPNIPRAKKLLVTRVPDDEREIPGETDRALGAPPLIGEEAKLRVSDCLRESPGKSVQQLLAIVKTNVGNDDAPGSRAPQGLPLELVLRGNRELGKTETCVPEGLRLHAVQTTVRYSLEHRSELFLASLPTVAIEKCGDATHACAPFRAG
jgi:hypothetical protein